METIEQLKQENDKLNARLAKAVEVFKEQRAQIEALQKYKDFDSVSRKNYDEAIEENNTLKNKVAELEDSYENLEAEYQAAINCNERNNKELLAAYEKTEELNKQLDEYELKLQNLEAAYEQLRQKYEDRVKETSDSQTQIAKLESDNQTLVQSNEQYKSAYNEVLNVKVPQLETRLKEVENNCINKDEEIESKNLFIKQLQTTYDEVFAKYNKLKENSISQADFDDEVNRLNATISDDAKAYKELLNQKEVADAFVIALQKQIQEYQEFNNKLIALVETINPYHLTSTQSEHSQSKVGNTHNQFMSDAPELTM